MRSALELVDLVEQEPDPGCQVGLGTELPALTRDLDALLAEQRFAGPHDDASAFLDIQAGAGGREAEAWAAMLVRMYLRWAQSQGFTVEVVHRSPGEGTGLKGASLSIQGPRAYGWLRTETGVHRLIRVSPFGAGNRLQTSFASVYVTPEVPEVEATVLEERDLVVQTYRASGPGGQYVNKTESAVRIRHVPTGVVVACQTERSQHRNRATALKLLQARVLDLELRVRSEAVQALENAKADVSFGSQIRTYALDKSYVKDRRTQVELTQVGDVLDGQLGPFLEAALRQGAPRSPVLA